MCYKEIVFMKIAIWLDKDYNPEEGGGFSYYDRLVKSIDAFTFDKPLDICFVTEGEVTSLGLSKDIIRLHYTYKVSFLKKVLSLLPYIGKIWKRKIKKQRQKVFENQNRKKRTHALILFATDYIKTEQMLSVAYLEKMIETVTRETDKEDLKLLLDTL